MFTLGKGQILSDVMCEMDNASLDECSFAS